MRTSLYKHGRPTFGVLTGWQTYVGTLHSFFEPLFRGMHLAAHDYGCNLLLACGMGRLADDSSLNPAWPVLASDSDFVPVGPWNTDGLIIIAPLITEARSKYIQTLRTTGHPVAFIGAGEVGPVVLPDNASGIRQAVAHLVAHGHRQIVYIASGVNGLREDDVLVDDGAYRLRAYLRSVHDYQLDADPRLLVVGRHSYDGGQEAMEHLLRAGLHFTAVLASNDESAIGAMRALKAAGRRVPEDVAVIGFDDRYQAIIQTPSLTTVHYPGFEMGYQALGLLAQRLQAGKASLLDEEIIPVPLRLVVRETCGCQLNNLLASPPEVEARLNSGPAFTSPPASPAADPVQKQLIQAMAEGVAAESRYLNLSEMQSLCWEIVQAFKLSLDQGEDMTFRVALVKALEQVNTADDDIHAWQAALSVLKSRLPTLLESWGSERATAEALNLLDQGRIVISANLRRQYNTYRVRQVDNIHQLGWMSARLSGAKDEASILKTLAEELPMLGLRLARVAFYQAEGDDPVAGYRMATDPINARHPFSSREFPAPELEAENRPFHWAILPLMLQAERLGFVAFDAVDIAAPCGAIVRLLAAALQSVRRYAADKEHVSELEQAYQALQENQARLLLADKMASLGRLTAGIAHEMNTPLAAVRGALTELGERVREYQQSIGDPNVSASDHQEIAQEMAEAVHLAEVAAERASGFVRGIKFQTRDLGPQEILRFKVVPVIQETLLLLSHALRTARCTVAFEPPAQPLELYGSPGRFSQVVTNLVTNALEASAPRGGGPITLRVMADDQELELRVSDQGGGIAPEVLPKIFDPMFTTKPFGEGTGLGLTIVHDVVVGEFGGRIKVDNRPDAGTSFILHFPLTATPSRPTSTP